MQRPGRRERKRAQWCSSNLNSRRPNLQSDAPSKAAAAAANVPSALRSREVRNRASYNTDHTPGLNAAAPVRQPSLTVWPAAVSTVVLLA